MSHELPRHQLRLTSATRGLAVICILGIVTLVYLSSLTDFFVSDDFHFVARAQQNAESSLSAGLWASLQHEPGMFYRPVVTFVNWLNFLVAGTNPVGWHAVNLLLHLIATGLVIGLMRRFVDSWWASLAAGLLFGVYFIHAEPVIWIAGRTSLLASVCVLAAVNLEFIPRRHHWSWQRWLALVFAIAGMFCRESAVIVPCLLLLLPAAPYNLADLARPSLATRPRGTLHRLWQRTITIWPYWLLSAAFLASRAQSVLASLYDQTYRLEIGLNALKNLAFVCAGTVYPLPFRSGLAAWNQWNDPSQSVPLLRFLLSIPDLLIGALVAMGIWVILLLWGNRAARRAAAWIVLAALPILFFRGTGERLLYLSSAGAACAIVATVTGWWAGLDRYRTTAGRWVCVAVIPLLVLLHFKWLAAKQDDWHKAATLSHAIITELPMVGQTLPSNATVRFTNLPDNINGAWVMRSSIKSAFALYGNRPDVMVLPPGDTGNGSTVIRVYSWNSYHFEPEGDQH